jgi:O-antigen ligase
MAHSARWLDLAPACLATLVLAAAVLLVGSTSSLIIYGMAGALITAAIVSLAVSGPRQGHFGLVFAMGLLALVALASGMFETERAAPHLAIWAAGLAAWSAGFVAARQRTAGVVWSVLVWSWAAVTAWWLFGQLGAAGGEAAAPSWIPAPETPVTSAVVFSLATLIGAARVLHVYKSAEAEDLPLATAADRILRAGLGGMLLFGFGFTALLATGSTTALLITFSVLCLHLWWDLKATLARERSRIRKGLLGLLAPIAALGLALAAGGLAYSRDESVPPGTPGEPAYPRIERSQIYQQAWLEAPMTGHGVGSIEAIRDSRMTLDTFATLRPPGDAQNVVLRQLVETGAVGAFILLGLFLYACVRILGRMGRMNGARSLPRLAVMACALTLFHGLAHSSLSIPAAIWTIVFLLGLAEGVIDLSIANRPAENE